MNSLNNISEKTLICPYCKKICTLEEYGSQKRCKKCYNKYHNDYNFKKRQKNKLKKTNVLKKDYKLELELFKENFFKQLENAINEPDINIKYLYFMNLVSSFLNFKKDLS